jgi:hypothetical protein
MRDNDEPLPIPGTDLTISNHDLIELIHDLEQDDDDLLPEDEERMFGAIKREIERRKKEGLM